MGTHAQSIITLGRFARNYGEMLVKDIRPEFAARKPRGAKGETIDTNHATFVYGHLGLYPARIALMLGADATAIKSPEAWEPLFKAGASCVDDVNGTVYPGWTETAGQYFRATDQSLMLLEHAHDAVLAAPHPDEKVRQRFPTIGDAMMFLMVGHTSMHFEQVSAWRRCMGLTTAM